MASTSVLSPPIPVDRSRNWSIRTAAIIFVAVLALVAAGIGRSALDDGPTHRNPAPAAAVPPQVEPMGTMAQLNALLLDTPEGRAALAAEFGAGSFGAQPSPSPSTLPASSASGSDTCHYRGPC